MSNKKLDIKEDLKDIIRTAPPCAVDFAEMLMSDSEREDFKRLREEAEDEDV